MEERRLRRLLRELAAEGVPATPDAWTAVRARLPGAGAPRAGGETPAPPAPLDGARSPRPDGYAPRPARAPFRAALGGLGLAALVALVLLSAVALFRAPRPDRAAGTGATPAATSGATRVVVAPRAGGTPASPAAACPPAEGADEATFLRCAFLTSPDLAPLEALGLVRELRLSQEADGLVVTLGRVYAGTDRIVLGYTTGWPGAVVFPESLTDNEGRAYRRINAIPAYNGLRFRAYMVTFIPTGAPPPPGVATFSTMMEQSQPLSETRVPGQQAPPGAWSFTFTLPIVAAPAPVPTPRVVATPASPSVVSAQRGGLTLRLALPKATYWAGEAGEATLTLRNDGPAPVALPSAAWGRVELVDEAGRRPEPWPWAVSRPGHEPVPGTLAPSEEVSLGARFQVPPADRVAGHTYTLRAVAQVADPAPTDGRYGNWAELTAATPIGVAPPGPAQTLRATLEADRAGWRLTVTDANGRPPAGFLWGEFAVAAHNLTGSGPLRGGQGGRWAEPWNNYVVDKQSAITVRIWVAAPGYVTVAVEATVPAPPLRRASVPPRADVAAVARACGPWPPPPDAPPDPALMRCAARVVAGQERDDPRAGLGISRIGWRDAAATLGVDPAAGPAPDRVVWLVEVGPGSPVDTVVVFDAETGAPILLLEAQAP